METPFKLTGTSTPITFHFVCLESWMFCTLNSSTGEVQIMSDWDNYAHRWNVSPPALGDLTLLQFFAAADNDYLAKKLTRRDQREAFDLEKTRAAALQQVLLRRSRRDIDAETARFTWDLISDIEADSIDEFTTQFYVDYIDGLDHPEARYSDTNGFIRLRDEMIPAIQSAIKERLTQPT